MDTKRLAKIFYFINIFPGPNARHVQMAKMIDSFMENSVEVEFILRRFEKKFADDIKSFYSLRNEFAYEEIKSIRYLPIDYDFCFRFNLLRKLGTLIQVEGGEAGRQAAIYTRQPTRGESLLEDIVRFKVSSADKHFPKVVAEVHERPSERGFKAVGLLDAVVVINPELKKVLTESGVDAGKILLAPSGVDIEDYRKKSQKDRKSIRLELDLPDDKHIIVYTGHLGYDRGVDTLVKAARYLDDGYLIVVVGGKTDDIRSVSQLISEEKVDSKVRMIGNRPASSIPLYQLSSDALVIPYSQKWRFQSWSSPMKLYEYMATKRPIISTDFKTIRSILDERSCVFVKPDDPKEMSQAIKRCIDDKELSYSISQRAFEIVQNFSWDKRAKKIINFISELE